MVYLFGEDKLRGIVYSRHSAEDKQENSVEIQQEEDEKFMAREGVVLLEHFADEGFSGLTADRPAFQEMFRKYVLDPNAPKIDFIVVYDASRFGRFQSRPEAWRLLSLMDERGIKLATVNRGLPKKDSNVMDDLMLILDFAQAGEYSKLLSEKVVAGCIKVSKQGYSAGAPAPYGCVRVLLSEERKRMGVLQPGEHKAIANQRVTFEPSTDGKAKIVKRIFNEFVSKGKFPDEIAEDLNQDKIPTATGKKWRAEGIVRILSNETYTGTRIYNRTWSRLKKQKRRNPESEWARCPNAHEALVLPEIFQMAKERLRYLRPRANSESVRRFRTTQKYVWRFIDQEIKGYSNDQRFYIRQCFPALFGSLYATSDNKRSCFYVPPQCRKFEKVLAFSVDTSFETEGLKNVYCLDSDMLQPSTYLIVEDGAVKPIDTAKAKELISDICWKLLESQAPWLKTDLVQVA